MNILDADTQYKLPGNLQRHQFEVAAVGLYVIDHWQGQKLNKRALVEAMLLHDMGNIVKFKRPFLGEMEKDAEYWITVQDEFIQKYGKNTHDATETIVQEVGASKDTLEIIRQMGFASNGEPLAKSIEAKIALFADTCVTPKGIEGFEVRVADLINRYGSTHSVKPEAWRRNAAEVQENVDVELDNLAQEDFSQAIDKLKETQLR